MLNKKGPRAPHCSPMQISRKRGAIRQFEAQLASGVKNTKEGYVALNDTDIKRIREVISNTIHNMERRGSSSSDSQPIRKSNVQEPEVKVKYKIMAYEIKVDSRTKVLRSRTFVREIEDKPFLIEALQAGRVAGWSKNWEYTRVKA